MSDFKEWTCVSATGMAAYAAPRPNTWYAAGTREEAEAWAARWGNVVAVPVPLFEYIKGLQRDTMLQRDLLTSDSATMRLQADKILELEAEIFRLKSTFRELQA
jgi:hypothetical protein